MRTIIGRIPDSIYPDTNEVVVKTNNLSPGNYVILALDHKEKAGGFSSIEVELSPVKVDALIGMLAAAKKAVEKN